MKNEPQSSAYVTRNTILKLLSDEEVARVSTAETASGLAQGDEYVDLEHLDQGVRRAALTNDTSTANLLPRKSVRDETWKKIVGMLGKAAAGKSNGAKA